MSPGRLRADDGRMSSQIVLDDDRSVGSTCRLSPTARKFVRDWGDLSDRWGLDRTTAEVHAVLWLAGAPMDLRAVADAARVDPEEAAHGLEALRERGIARLVDRSSGTLQWAVARDPAAMFLAILEDRRRREVEPAMAVLRDAVLRADSDDRCDDATRARLEEMQSFFRDANRFWTQISTMPAPLVRRLFRIGGKIRRAFGVDGARGGT